MVHFPLHSVESAPEASRPGLTRAGEVYGNVPNMYRMLAEAPVALDAYQRLGEIFAESSLTPLEQQIVYITAAHKNQCHYCTAQVPPFGAGEAGRSLAELVRSGGRLPDPKLQALRSFTASLVEQRGWVSETMVEAFMDAGYDRAQILEVITGVALVTISSYSNHLAATPIDGDEPAVQRLAS